MSPLSIGQYLDPTANTFDLVVIDEASQMLPEDALSAILRGNQLVVVGDPEQLPPTTFFAYSNASQDHEDDEEGPPPESILELSHSRYKPMRELLWHYRSQHQSLIAFSNHQFYGDRLIVFPSPIAQDDAMGVRRVYVNGLYKTGTGLNIPEAEQVVKEAVQFMKLHPDLSLGIATVNLRQAEYLLQEFDSRYETDPDVQAYRDRWEDTLEPFFVKNLENVQGDERSAIFISTVYGPDENGRVHQRFGPINTHAGYRRLNVLFTRAKRHLRLFTSLRPEQVLPSETSHRGVRVLKDYLEYAAMGRLHTGTLSGAEPESDFERFVLERLRNAGYGASCQVGVAGYRIDIAVQHPANPHLFILGIECDGATYHSSRFARERDRIRQQVLENLGWQIYRIWSTDWFAAPDEEFSRLVHHIESILRSMPPIPMEVKGDAQVSPTSDELPAAPCLFDVQTEPEDALNANGAKESPPAESAVKLAVKVGDRVTYRAVGADDEVKTVVIGQNLGGWSDLVISLETPVAQGLLGTHEDEMVRLHLPRKIQEVVVVRIDRAASK